MECLTFAHYYRKKLCQPCVMPAGQLAITLMYLSSSQTLFGLGMKLHVHMCTKLENGARHNEQEQGSAVNNFINQGEFEATKMLSVHGAPHCDKHQFHAEMMVSSLLKPFSRYHG